MTQIYVEGGQHLFGPYHWPVIPMKGDRINLKEGGGRIIAGTVTRCEFTGGGDTLTVRVIVKESR